MLTSVTPSQFVLDHAPWSMSKANVAQQCPYKFYHQYVAKTVLSPKPYHWAMNLGNAVHKLIEYMLVGQTEEQCRDVIEQQFQFTTQELEIYLGFVPAVKEFIAKFEAYKLRHTVKSYTMESQLAVDLAGAPISFFNNRGFLRGVLDMAVFFNNTHTALILDHKTGQRYPFSHWEDTFNVYALLLKTKEPALERIKTGVHYVREANIEFDEKYKDVRDVRKLFDTVVQFLNKATTLTPNFQLVQPSGLCENHCDYYNLCLVKKADGTNDHKKQNDPKGQNPATLDAH